MSCDTCSAEFVTKHYPAEDFEFSAEVNGELLTIRSEGGWDACTTCAMYIDKELPAHLLRHSVDSYLDKRSLVGEEREEYRKVLTPLLAEAHELFWIMRQGKGVTV